MADVAVSANPIAAVINKVVAVIFSGGAKVAEGDLAVEVPILEAPVIGTIVNQAIEAFADDLDGIAANMVSVIVTDIQTNGEQSAVVKAKTALDSATKSGDANAIKTAQSAVVSAWASLGNFDGA